MIENVVNTPAGTFVGKELVDLREQLVNGGEIGPIERVSTRVEMITSIRGILLDFDPELLGDRAGSGPKELYEKVVGPMLARDPVFRQAEVRISGRGLHCIVWFDEPVQLKTEADRQRWAPIIKAIQRILPTDPNCPGITALTRPIGSMNGKNEAEVTRLVEGLPVSTDQVVNLFERIRQAPFATAAELILGGVRICPCPICLAEAQALVACPQVGKCYGCGTVQLSQVFDLYLRPKATNQRPSRREKEACHG